jgi:hypothetical protein
MTQPWHAWLLLASPPAVLRTLAKIRASGLISPVPNVWQIELGVLRMWHRVIFRPETIGTCSARPVRQTWRARLLQWRPLRFPFLIWEKAIAPLDMCGLVSSRERVLRHLLGAHHDADQALYDLEMLSLHPGAIEELSARLVAQCEGGNARTAWLRDLCVYEQYHEDLLGIVRRFQDQAAVSVDPDISFLAYLTWCSGQPANPRATWRAWRDGRWRLSGLEVS